MGPQERVSRAPAHEGDGESPRRIEATPVVTGTDAEALKASIAQVASPEEIERRKKAARQFCATVTKPKSAKGGTNDEGIG